MSAEEVAARIGITGSEYFDVEAHPDEFTTVLSMAEARALCRELGLQLIDVVASEGLHADLPAEQQVARAAMARSAFLRQTRESLGISIPELAFAIGFEDTAVEAIEREEQYLDTLPIAVVAEISRKLNLPLLSLIEPTQDV